jgi:hypothetical protein
MPKYIQIADGGVLEMHSDVGSGVNVGIGKERKRSRIYPKDVFQCLRKVWKRAGDHFSLNVAYRGSTPLVWGSDENPVLVVTTFESDTATGPKRVSEQDGGILPEIGPPNSPTTASDPRWSIITHYSCTLLPKP